LTVFWKFSGRGNPICFGLVKKLLFLGHFMQKTRTDNVFLNDKNRIEVSGYVFKIMLLLNDHNKFFDSIHMEPFYQPSVAMFVE